MICYGVGGWHPRGVQRLEDSLRGTPNPPDLLAWTEHPAGCPTHQELPYAFKPWAFEEADRIGYRLAMWMDASCWVIRDLAPLWERIEREGHLLFRGGWSVGQWCKDEALDPLGMTRDEAMAIPDIHAAVIGLDLWNPDACAWLEEWALLSRDGVTFPGPWRNDNGEASADERVLGHRHDQTAASALAHRHGFKLANCPWGFAFYTPDPDPETVILAQGM